MNTKVTVIASQEGLVVRPNENKPEFGFVRVSQKSMAMENGFLVEQSRSALITGKIELLNRAGFHNGQALEGKIVVKESTTPFNTENPDGDLKIAGKSGVPCRIGGMPIYRKSFYETKEAVDTLIAHDNSDEIKGAQLASASAEGLDQA